MPDCLKFLGMGNLDIGNHSPLSYGYVIIIET